MEWPRSEAVENIMRVAGPLSAVMKRIEAAMEENCLAIERVKTCPAPCFDCTVPITPRPGTTLRVRCPVANPACAYGSRLKHDLNDYLARVMSESGVPRRHLECLVNFRDSLSLQAACEWTYRGFLLICGNPGTGKSFTAACLLRKYLSSRIPDRMDRHTWEEAERNCSSTAWMNAAELYGDREAIKTAKAAHLLVLDDFGGDGDAKENHSAINRVISARYDAIQPTIVITELAIEGIKARYGYRTAEKIVGKPRDGSMIVECRGN
jgi:DNA replication protein DnaC